MGKQCRGSTEKVLAGLVEDMKEPRNRKGGGKRGYKNWLTWNQCGAGGGMAEEGLQKLYRRLGNPGKCTQWTPGDGLRGRLLAEKARC